ITWAQACSGGRSATSLWGSKVPRLAVRRPRTASRPTFWSGYGDRPRDGAGAPFGVLIRPGEPGHGGAAPAHDRGEGSRVQELPLGVVDLRVTVGNRPFEVVGEERGHRT